jgi:hypothetical protein
MATTRCEKSLPTIFFIAASGMPTTTTRELLLLLLLGDGGGGTNAARTLVHELEEGVVHAKEAGHTEQGVHGFGCGELAHPQEEVLPVIQQEDAALVQLLARQVVHRRQNDL